MKSFLKSKFSTLYFFYQYLGSRLFLLLIFSFLMVIMDSIGIAMFVPLIQIADGNTVGSEDKIYHFIQNFFEFLKIDLNPVNMLILIVILFSIKGVCFYYAGKYLAINQQMFSKEIRSKMIDGVRDLKYKEFIGIDIGRLQNSLIGEAWQVVFACNQYLETIKNGMFVIIYLGFAFFLDWKFSILVTIGGLLSNFIYKYFYKKTERLSREITKNNHRYGGVVIEVVNHYKYLKATGRSIDFFKRLQKELSNLISSGIEVAKLNAKLSALREPMTIAIICLVIAVHIIFFQSPLAAIMIILLFFYRAMQKIVDIQTNWNNYLANIGSVENVQEFQNYLDSNRENNNGFKIIDHIDSIELKDVDLNFSDHKILNNINLNINKNQSIAFVGESGSGKTSLVNIISTLLPNNSGTIHVNGENLSSINNSVYRGKVGYITQDPTIFNATIFENITFWDDKNQENLTKFHNTLSLSGLNNYIQTLDNKEDTLLGNNGINISGGQKQRISIARELYRNVDLLIMDEATSALDSETEQIIKESIDKLKGKITIISIAHRLSTIKNADIIYLMEQGKITSSGTFEELKKNSTYFQKLTDLQGL